MRRHFFIQKREREMQVSIILKCKYLNVQKWEREMWRTYVFNLDF